MNICITYNGKTFGFSIKEDGKLLFSSADNEILPFVSGDYPLAIDAYKDALKLAGKKYHLEKFAQEELDAPLDIPIVDVSAEEMMVNHYRELLSSMEQKAAGEKPGTDTYDVVLKEIEAIEQELKGVINAMGDEAKEDRAKIVSLLKGFGRLKTKYFPHTRKSQKTASLNRNEKIEILEDYAERACRALSNRHSDLIPVVDLGEYSVIKLVPLTEKIPVIVLRVNKKLQLDNIIPKGSVSKTFPCHTGRFYQVYWKPIAEAIGHFDLSDCNVCLNTRELPDIIEDRLSIPLNGWNYSSEGREDSINLCTNGGDDLWLFNPSKKCMASDQSQSHIVKCIDPALKSIYGRTGIVISDFSVGDNTEIDVDFGRGLDIVRLTPSQIEIVNA